MSISRAGQWFGGVMTDSGNMHPASQAQTYTHTYMDQHVLVHMYDTFCVHSNINDNNNNNNSKKKKKQKNKNKKQKKKKKKNNDNNNNKKQKKQKQKTKEKKEKEKIRGRRRISTVMIITMLIVV